MERGGAGSRGPYATEKKNEQGTERVLIYPGLNRSWLSYFL